MNETMANSLNPEIVRAIEERVEKIKADYQERLKKDRDFVWMVLGKLGWALALVATAVTYFGIKGFDDLVNSAIQRNFPKEQFQAILENGRDLATVQSLLTERDHRATYSPLEMEAFHRLLKNNATRDQTFTDVITLLRGPRTNPDLATTLATMTTILRGQEQFAWIRDFPTKQEALILYLAEHRHDAASSAVLPHLHSHKRDVQLATVRYLRDCRVYAATEQLAKIITERTANSDVRSASAVALISLDPEHPQAQKWLSELKSRPSYSLPEAAAALSQAAVIATIRSQRAGSADRNQQRVSRQAETQSSAQDPALLAATEVLRGVLIQKYFLTLAEPFDEPTRRFLYVAKTEREYSEIDISPSLLSEPVVNHLLNTELKNARNLENFKHLIRGLSGIVTDRDVIDRRQDVILLLGRGEIEFSDGKKVSPAMIDRQNRDQLNAIRWNIRTWKLSVDERGELIAESASSLQSRLGGRSLGGKVKAISLQSDSNFLVTPARDEVYASNPSPSRVRREGSP